MSPLYENLQISELLPTSALNITIHTQQLNITSATFAVNSFDIFDGKMCCEIIWESSNKILHECI